MANNIVLFDTSSNGVATITLNRPNNLNALNLEMTQGLDDALIKAERDEKVRSIVLQGSGAHFMAGGDIKWFNELISSPNTDLSTTFENIIAKVNNIVLRMQRIPKPIIASVQGAAAGFGLSLIGACDLAIAANNSYFTLAYCHIGTTPDGGSTYSLPRAVGTKKAMEIALLGNRFNAEQALNIGLINWVTELDTLNSQTQKIAEQLAKGPAFALGRTKQLINQSLDSSLPQQLIAEQQSFAQCAVKPDFTEGLAAFVENRKPNFNK